MLKAKIQNETFLICNWYGPNTDCPQFYEAVYLRCEQTGIDRKLIAGDLNVIIDEEKDRKGFGMHQNKNARKVVKTKIKQLELVDIWRVLNTDDNGFTWRRLKPRPLFERLDLFLIAKSLEQMAEKIEVLPSIHSDHSIVCLKICENFTQGGKGYWKLNTSLLQDPQYVDAI